MSVRGRAKLLASERCQSKRPNIAIGNSPAQTYTSCRRARCRAPRSVRRTARAHKTSQHFVVFAPDAICTSDDANCRCRAWVTLRPRGPGGTKWAGRPLRSWRSALARGSDWTLATSFSLWTLRSDRSRRSGRAGRAALAHGSLGADRSLLALCALGTSRTNRTRRASFASWTWRTLRSWRRGARRQHNDRDGSRNGHQLSHQPPPCTRPPPRCSRSCTQAHKAPHHCS
jgi:hypothetical protein